MTIADQKPKQPSESNPAGGGTAEVPTWYVPPHGAHLGAAPAVHALTRIDVE